MDPNATKFSSFRKIYSDKTYWFILVHLYEKVVKVLFIKLLTLTLLTPVNAWTELDHAKIQVPKGADMDHAKIQVPKMRGSGSCKNTGA